MAFTGAPFMGNKTSGLRDFTDGTSNTILCAEVIMGVNSSYFGIITLPNNLGRQGPYDHRGDVLNDDYNCTLFNTYTPPNSRIPDQMGNYTFCGNLYQNNPPCNNLNPSWNAARSRHPGGVNVLMGDGSVKFVKDTINFVTWRSLGSPGAGEVVSADSY